MSTKKYVFNFIQNIRIFVEFCHEKRYILGVLSKSLGVTGIIVSEISLYSIYSISDQPISLYSINSIIVCPYGHWKSFGIEKARKICMMKSRQTSACLSSLHDIGGSGKKPHFGVS